MELNYINVSKSGPSGISNADVNNALRPILYMHTPGANTRWVKKVILKVTACLVINNYEGCLVLVASMEISIQQWET